jgi:hypothetical protein
MSAPRSGCRGPSASWQGAHPRRIRAMGSVSSCQDGISGRDLHLRTRPDSAKDG